jgi:hypothetical protein
MDPDFDEINHFIYDKINNYNKKFEEFTNNLNIQDNKIKKECRKKIHKAIKDNPKKIANDLVKLTEMNTSDDTSENDYILEKNSIEDIQKSIMRGGNNPDDSEIEIIEEIIEENNNTFYDKSLNSYTNIYMGIFMFFVIYISIYLLLLFFEVSMEHLYIFNPLIILTKNIYPKALHKSE